MSLDQITDGTDPKELYDILQQIGQGSYGTVHQAFSMETSEIVAVKIIPLQEGEASQSVIKEVQFMKEISEDKHPNIVNFINAYHDQQNNDLWIVMDYCSAGALTDLMREANRVLDENEAALVIKETIEGLKYLHAKKIMHRDIKANNLLITDEGTVKLADFGVSFQLQQTCEKRKSVIGTPYWMAPEIYKGEPYGMSSDIWSLGITLYEILEGKPPLAGIHPMRAMLLIPQQDAPTLRNKKSPLTNREYSPECIDFIEKMLVKVPAQRADLEELGNHPFLQKALPLDALLSHRYDGRISMEVSPDSKIGYDTVVRQSSERKSERRSMEVENGTVVRQSKDGEGYSTVIRRSREASEKHQAERIPPSAAAVEDAKPRPKQADAAPKRAEAAEKQPAANSAKAQAAHPAKTQAAQPKAQAAPAAKQQHPEQQDKKSGCAGQ